MIRDQKDPQTYTIIGAAMEVHTELGWGFLEAAYQEALAHEFGLRGIPSIREAPIEIAYKGTKLACTYRADFICYGQILVELKALAHLTDTEKAQVCNYLKATNLNRALLINFGTNHLEYQRMVNHYQNT